MTTIFSKKVMDYNFDDIIDLPHHVSKHRPQMPMEARAAQFAPFAALTGFATTIRETARQTEKQIQLDDDSYAILDRKLAKLKERIDKKDEIEVTHYIPDQLKDGGHYCKSKGFIAKIDYQKRCLQLKGTEELYVIHIDLITDIQCDIFDEDSMLDNVT